MQETRAKKGQRIAIAIKIAGTLGKRAKKPHLRNNTNLFNNLFLYQNEKIVYKSFKNEIRNSTFKGVKKLLLSCDMNY